MQVNQGKTRTAPEQLGYAKHQVRRCILGSNINFARTERMLAANDPATHNQAAEQRWCHDEDAKRISVSVDEIEHEGEDSDCHGP